VQDDHVIALHLLICPPTSHRLKSQKLPLFQLCTPRPDTSGKGKADRLPPVKSGAYPFKLKIIISNRFDLFVCIFWRYIPSGRRSFLLFAIFQGNFQTMPQNPLRAVFRSLPTQSRLIAHVPAQSKSWSDKSQSFRLSYPITGSMAKHA